MLQRSTDALTRIAGQELEQTMGQPIIVVPKPGADGGLAAGEVKRAAPDGYTFMFGTNSPLAVVPNMQKEPPYNVLTDFTPVTYLGDNTFIHSPSHKGSVRVTSIDGRYWKSRFDGARRLLGVMPGLVSIEAAKAVLQSLPTGVARNDEPVIE